MVGNLRYLQRGRNKKNKHIRKLKSDFFGDSLSSCVREEMWAEPALPFLSSKAPDYPIVIFYKESNHDSEDYRSPQRKGLGRSPIFSPE
jgi:hypothetical protein